MTVPEGLAKSAEDPLFTFITTDAMVIYTGLYPCKVSLIGTKIFQKNNW